MEVKPGFKNTEVGVIPDDWLLCTIGSLGVFSKGYGIRKDESERGSIPCVRYGEIYTIHNDIIRSYYSFISPDVAKKSKKLKKGDILFAGSGETKEEIGKSVALIDDIEVFAGGDIIILSPSIGDSCFFGYLFNYPTISHQKASRGQGDAIVHLRTSAISSIIIPFPPSLHEQKAIATAINDIDVMIKSLEKLIEKKRCVKTGAKQKLLRPKRNWVEMRLGKTAVLKGRIGWQGLTTSEYLDSGDCYLVTGTDFNNGFINWSKCHFVGVERYEEDKNIQLRQQDVLVTKDGTIGKVAIVDRLIKPATLNSGVFVIRPIENAFHPVFFYYILTSEVFTKFLSQLSAGSTINHLYQKDFVNFNFLTPVTIKEQADIAKSLSDIDAEIALLEMKLFKINQIKQGMLFDLLTGRIRLI